MGRKPGLLDGFRDDVLKASIAAIAVAMASGLSAAVLSGAWQKALLAASGLGILTAALILAAEATRHAQELAEVQYDRERAKDAQDRQLAKFERDQRDHITRAATSTSDAASQNMDLSTMLERSRKHISSGRAGPVELLVVQEAEPNLPQVVSQAGSFDQAVLADPARLVDWIETLGDQVYSSSLAIDGKAWRVLAIADDEALDAHDKFEIQRVATHLAALKLAHRVAAAGSIEETA